MSVYRRKNITYECLLNHQSVVPQVLNASDGVFNKRKRLTFNEEVCINEDCVTQEVKDLIRIIVKFRTE